VFREYSLTPLADRLWSKVDKTDGCWLFTGALNNKGYGVIHERGKGGTNLYAHRVSYGLLVGPIPDDLELDHLCRVTRCVNPEHLEAVTHAENMRRARH
jgi:hypothetical protein